MFSFSVIFLVFLGAIFVIFCHDFIELFKKIFAIRWVALIFPLLVVTTFVVRFEPTILMALLYIKLGLMKTILYLSQAMPYNAYNVLLMPTCLILMLTLSPVYTIKKLKARKMIIPFCHGGIISLFIWLFLIILYAVSSHG